METPGILTRTLQRTKKIALMGARRCGVYSAFKHSTWRNHRLLILGYHGISLRDEHEWRPGLFISSDQFASRLKAISRTGCAVLPLGEAIECLQAGTLPPMSVVITFDDGFYNFFSAAHPLLKRFDYPATVYQTTFYTACNKPVFHLLCHYLLWKASGRKIDAQPIIGRSGIWDLTTEDGINVASVELWNHARALGLSPDERQRLAKLLADSVGVDYQEIVHRRIFNLMNRDELSEMVKCGVDLQLHTHRHRVPLTKDLFLKELTDNRRFLEQIGQSKAAHFAYPSGVYREEVFPWLSELGLRSATTCETGLATSHSNSMCLPRFIDATQVSELEFEGWLCGVRGALPARTKRRTALSYSPAPANGPAL
jgi:peptidoglycan/xylan/chitin deacetylase (PgdA/CDA1 family)